MANARALTGRRAEQGEQADTTRVMTSSQPQHLEGLTMNSSGLTAVQTATFDSADSAEVDDDEEEERSLRSNDTPLHGWCTCRTFNGCAHHSLERGAWRASAKTSRSAFLNLHTWLPFCILVMRILVFDNQITPATPIQLMLGASLSWVSAADSAPTQLMVEMGNLTKIHRGISIAVYVYSTLSISNGSLMQLHPLSTSLLCYLAQYYPPTFTIRLPLDQSQSLLWH